jgi:hypothetical protein
MIVGERLQIRQEKKKRRKNNWLRDRCPSVPLKTANVLSILAISKHPPRLRQGGTVPERIANRRSSRVTLCVPLQICDPDTNRCFASEDACSLKVSLWGGLIALKSTVSQGQKLSVVNEATRKATESHVVYMGPMHLDRRLVAIEFLQSSPGFWGLTFPSVGSHRQQTRSSYYA